MKKSRLLFGCLLTLLGACMPNTRPVELEKPTVIVSILPQSYFVEKIAGDLVSVQAMVESGDDPHTYEPTPFQMRALSESDLYFTIGIEFEKIWIPRFQDANPDLRVFDSAAGIVRIPLTDSHAEDESSEGLDPHIWLSPGLAKVISQNISKGLSEFDPSHSSVYQANLEELLEEIEKVDTDIRIILKDRVKNDFMVIHPAWGYFANEYGLGMLAIEVAGNEPGPEELVQLLDLARVNQVSCIFVQKGGKQTLAQSIAGQIGVDCVEELDPMAKNWSTNMLLIAEKIAGALR